MKKAYQKPRLYYESFQLSHSIASGCYGIANFEESACSVTIPEWDEDNEIFQIDFVCPIHGPGVGNLICYHGPSDDKSVFSS